MQRISVAYILYRFPTLSETFIARELESLCDQGMSLTVVSLLCPRSGPTYPVSENLAEQVNYVPGPLQAGYWKALLYYVLCRPRILARVLLNLLRQPYPAMFLPLMVWRIYMFTKGVAAAYLLKDTQVNLLHTHFAAWPGAATVVVAALLKLPFTVTAGHGYDLYTPSTLLEFVVSYASRVVTVAEQRRRDILARCPTLARDNVPIIPCSIQVKDFPYRIRQVANHIGIISVGRLIEAKGHEYLIQACCELKRRGIAFHCTIVGTGSTQARQDLERLVTTLGLDSHVFLAGARSFKEILNYYQEHDIYVMPCVVAQDNTRDATPVVFVEAAATGLPLVSTAVGGVPEIVIDGVTGLLVPERNALAVADAITLLAGNPSLRQHFGSNGRAEVETRFDSVRNAARLTEIFYEVADGI